VIEANKKPWFELIFYHYNGWLIRRWFANVSLRLQGDALPQEPTLFIVNHSSWWDGLIIFQLNRAILKYDSYVMMSEEGLKKFQFFRKIGAFSIHRDSPADIRKSMRYAIDRLVEPPLTPHARPKALWLFPQGHIHHQDVRPLSFQPGLSFLLQRMQNMGISVPVVPIAIYYDFGSEQKPHIYLSIGNAIRLPPSAAAGDHAKHCEMTLTAMLDQMREEIIADMPQNYTTMIHGIHSISDRFLKIFRPPTNRLN
jgi:1-acyl-sn-glycerol-3-phosphate acyltransferase